MTTPDLHHVDALPPGTRLAEFEVQGLMGFGGFGMVYRAYDHSLHRTVAIKEYMPAALARRAGMSVVLRASSDGAIFQAGLRSFMAEARLLAQFDHPSLVKVFRAWEHNGTAYMVMPLYQGVTLKQAREQMRHAPPEAWLRKLLWSMLEALKVLHRHHTVHRDISPDNIVLQDIGPPVLLDLGAARRALGERTQHRHTAILKVNYAPIEQYADTDDMRQGPWSDLYALSAVVHGCLAGSPPPPATFRVLRDRMTSVAALAEGLHEASGLRYSPAFVQALTQGLALQPADRPQSASAFAELLGLQPVEMESFDWRAELGDIWQPQAAAHAVARAALPTHDAGDWTRLQGAGVPMPPSDEHAYVATLLLPQRPQPAAGAARASTGPRPSGPAVGPPAPARLRHWPVAAGAALALALLVTMGLVSAPGQPPPLAAATPAPPAQQAAAATVSAAPPVTLLGPAPVADAAALAAAPAPVEEVLESAPQVMVLTDAEPPAVAAAAPAPVARSAEPRRRRDLGAEDICPDSNFLTRPMCLHRACQRSAYARMPVCVEHNLRMRENHRHLDP